MLFQKELPFQILITNLFVLRLGTKKICVYNIEFSVLQTFAMLINNVYFSRKNFETKGIEFGNLHPSDTSVGHEFVL
jgi:hypothetical protein